MERPVDEVVLYHGSSCEVRHLELKYCAKYKAMCIRDSIWPDGAVWRDGTPCRDVEARTGGEAWTDREIWPAGEAWPAGTSRKAGKDRETWTDSADCADDEPCRGGQTVRNIFALTSPYYVRRIQKAFGPNVVRQMCIRDSFAAVGAARVKMKEAEESV